MRTPDPATAFARTNRQTIAQRAAIIQERLPNATSVADLCCGDCSQQWSLYRQILQLERYWALDILPEIAAANRRQGITCLCGDALDEIVLRRFLDFDVVFFGPPLSTNCDGHNLLPFHQITPSYAKFIDLFLRVLAYRGTLICICPKSTHMGQILWLYNYVQQAAPGWGLRLIHHSFSTLTRNGNLPEPRLKYIELWFSTCMGNDWEICASRP